jgi:hypothetical protein
MSNVYVSLVGGVGNQLFQIAAGYAYAKTYNKNLVLDTTRWTGSQGKHPDTYKNTLFKNFTFTTHHPRQHTEVFEKRFNFDPLPYFKGDVRLNGYFQSFKYFEHYKDEFLNLLEWPDVPVGWLASENVAFHIRRGDYIQHGHVHFICDKKYFSKQFEEFSDPVHQMNVFTDDPDAVQVEFQGHNFNIIQTNSELEDLRLMSLHDSIVCSNSSFSWWASLIGKQKEKIIVPDIWFKNFQQHDDIYRSDFTRIAV